MKIFPLLTLLPALLFAAAWDGTANTSWYTNPNATTYTISTAEELAGLAALVNDGTTFKDKIIKLGANIVLNDTNASGGWRNWNESTSGLKSWTPIGTTSDGWSPFYGNFDGNGKVISGLYGTVGGLFGHIIDGSINNLGLAGFYVFGAGMVNRSVGITISNSYAIGNVEGNGGIIGSSQNDIIANTYFIGNVNGDADVGGIVGHSLGNLTITNTYVIGNVSGSDYHVGGIVGGNYYKLTISNAYIIGNVSGSGDYVGGIVGLISNLPTITNVYIIGNVSGGGNNVGGIVGICVSDGPKITNTYVIGNVTGGNNVGGIAGNLVNAEIISNTYVIGSVTGIDNVSGMVGYINSGKVTIFNTYFIGDVIGGSNAGIVVGYQNSGTISATGFFYNTNLAPSIFGTAKTTEEMKNILTYFASGWDFNSIWAINPNVNNSYPFLQSSTYHTKEKNQISEASDIPSTVEFYTGLPIEPAVGNVIYKGTKLTKGTDYDVLYYNNVNVGSEAKIIIMGKGNYYGIKVVNFRIINQKRNIADVIIDPIIPEQITGDSIKPKPIIKDFSNTVTLREGKDYALEYYENKYAGQAIIKISGLGAYESSRTINFSIVGRIPLTVQWSEEREFIYNKMVQVPTTNIDRNDIQWRVVNARSEAGEYTDANKLAPFVIITSANANSFELLNNTVNYEIKKRPLNPYFKAPATLSNFESNTDTLWVPRKVFADSSALQNILESIVSYDGFAQDTVTKEKDDISVLKNSPTINFTYALKTAQKMLAKRVETTQTAVAVINTDGVSADNYAIAKRSIMIMETVEDEEGTENVFCFRGNHCTELSEEICTFFNGTPVESCGIKISCLVEAEGKCATNLSLEQCRGIGGTVVSSCESTPIISTRLTNQMHVWQTASGVVNLDLGYMPAEPVAVQIYDLKGKLITTGEASTRFASVRLNAGGGVYLFKAGNRSVVKALR